MQNPLLSTGESSTYYDIPYDDEDFGISVILNVPVVAGNRTTPMPRANPTSTPFDNLSFDNLSFENLSSIVAIAMEQRRPFYCTHRNHRNNNHLVTYVLHLELSDEDYRSEDGRSNNSMHHCGRDKRINAVCDS